MIIRLDIGVSVTEIEDVIRLVLDALEKAEKKINEGWHLSDSDIAVDIDNALMDKGVNSIPCTNWVWLPEREIDISVYAGYLEEIRGDIIWVSIERCTNEEICDCSS